jgi:hypothetical protein
MMQRAARQRSMHWERAMKFEQMVSLVWIVATAAVALVALAIVFLTGLYLNAGAQFSPNVPARLPGLYLALKENGALVAGLTGFSAVAWALWQGKAR